MMEPFRPFVDEIVHRLYREGKLQIDKEAKYALLSCLSCDTHYSKVTRPLQIGLSMTMASLEAKEVHIKRVREFMPTKGKLTILAITDKQYSEIINIWGQIEQKVKKVPIQLEFF